MSNTGETIAAAALIQHLDASKQHKELEAISSALQQLQSAQLSEAARRVAIEQVRDQIVALNSQQKEASRALDSGNPEAVEAAAYLILDVKETLGSISTSVLPDIQDKEYLRALQENNSELITKLLNMLGSERIKSLEQKVIAGNIYEDVALYTCASGTVAQNSSFPLARLFWWNSGRRALMRGFTSTMGSEFNASGGRQAGPILPGLIAITAGFILKPILLSLGLTVLCYAIFGRSFARGDDFFAVFSTFTLLFAFISIAIAIVSTIYRSMRRDSLRKWATENDIKPEAWIDNVFRMQHKHAMAELRTLQPQLASKLARIGITWPKGLRPGTQEEVDFLSRTRVAVKRLAGYE